MLFSLATAARFLRHATTIRAAFGARVPKHMETLAARYDAAALYLHDRHRRNRHDRSED